MNVVMMYKYGKQFHFAPLFNNRVTQNNELPRTLKPTSKTNNPIFRLMWFGH